MQQLASAAVQFTARANQYADPYDVLRGLERVPRSDRETQGLHVLGAWYWNHNPTDIPWVEGKNVFTLQSRALTEDYVAGAKKYGLSSTTLLARRTSAPYTLTEAMRQLRPTGDGRWLILLLRRYGIRDLLYCPFTRWTVGYWSPHRIELGPQQRGLLFMAASAAVGQIERIRRYPAMTAKSPLSARETEVLQLASTGLTAPQIAKTLDVATKTVRHQLAAAARKLGAKNTTHAVAEAMRQHFIV